MRRSFEMDLVLGVANLLADNPEAEVQLWSQYSAEYDPALADADGQPGSYVPNPARPEGAVPILVDAYGGDGPYVVVSDYTVDDTESSSPVLGLQFVVRAEQRDAVKAVTSDIYALLHMRWGGMLGAIRLVNASRSSGTSAGQDSNNRQGRIENYYARVYRPTPNRQE